MEILTGEKRSESQRINPIREFPDMKNMKYTKSFYFITLNHISILLHRIRNC